MLDRMGVPSPPTLMPDDTVILDNLGSHKVAEICRIIKGRGARLLFLSFYYSDLNPVELGFANLKAALRETTERSVDDLWHRIGRSRGR